MTPVYSLWIKRTASDSCFCHTGQGAKTRDPAGRDRRFYRLPARPGVLCEPTISRSGCPRPTSHWCASPTGCAPSPPPVSTFWVSPILPPACSTNCAASTRSSPGTAPTARSFATSFRPGPSVPLPSGAAARGRHRARHRFLSPPGARSRAPSACDRIPRIHCDVQRGRLRGHPSLLGKRPQELAAGKIPPAGARAGAQHAGALVRRAGRSAARRRGAHRRSVRIGPLAGRAPACTSATIPASPTWRRPRNSRCWRSSAPPIPGSGRRAARTCAWPLEPLRTGAARVTISAPRWQPGSIRPPRGRPRSWSCGASARAIWSLCSGRNGRLVGHARLGF